jgi:hypothetical protein
VNAIAICAGKESVAMAALKSKTKSLLVVTFDVTDFTDEQIDKLMFEVSVQGEESDDHPESIVSDYGVFKFEDVEHV